jgi:hypothetical protein
MFGLLQPPHLFTVASLMPLRRELSDCILGQGLSPLKLQSVAVKLPRPFAILQRHYFTQLTVFSPHHWMHNNTAEYCDFFYNDAGCSFHQNKNKCTWGARPLFCGFRKNYTVYTNVCSIKPELKLKSGKSKPNVWPVSRILVNVAHHYFTGDIWMFFNQNVFLAEMRSGTCEL